MFHVQMLQQSFCKGSHAGKVTQIHLHAFTAACQLPSFQLFPCLLTPAKDLPTSEWSWWHAGTQNVMIYFLLAWVDPTSCCGGRKMVAPLHVAACHDDMMALSHETCGDLLACVQSATVFFWLPYA